MKLPCLKHSVCVVVLCVSWLAGGEPARSAGMSRLLPASREVTGWSVYPKTLTHCAKPSDLTQIYDGGLELYTRNGVIEAVSQIYQKNKTTTEVVIHRMKSNKMSRSFLRYWQTQGGSKPFAKPAIKDEAFLSSEGGTTAGYLARGAYFITVKVNARGKDAQTSATNFLKVMSKKIIT